MERDDEFLNVHEIPIGLIERFSNSSSNWFGPIHRTPRSFATEGFVDTTIDFTVGMDTPACGIGITPSLALDVPLQRRHLSQVSTRTARQRREQQYQEAETTRRNNVITSVRRYSETDIEEEFRQIRDDEELARLLQAQFDGELETETVPRTGPRFETSVQRSPSPEQLPFRIDAISSSDSDTFEEMLHQPNSRILEQAVPRRFRRRIREPGISRFDFQRRRVNRRANSQSNVDEYETLWNLTESLGDAVPRGLKEEQLSRLPIRTVLKDASCSGASRATSKDDKECLVCLTEFRKNDSLRILPCFHEYHVDCIDKWLKNNNSCPICRVRVDFDCDSDSKMIF